MINVEMRQYGKERSAIRELFEKGKVLKEKYGESNVFDFSLGNPSIPCPEIVNDTLINLLTNAKKLDNNISSFDANDINKYRKLSSTDLHGYSSAQGDKLVRDAISAYLNKTYNADTTSDFIYLTSGAAAGLTICLKALTSGNINEEVIVFAPFFPEYTVFIKNANAKPIIVEPDYETFYPDLNDFKNKITKNTSVVIINSPNNPTGVLYNEQTIIDICNILKEKEREYNHPIYIISDEPYRELIYVDKKYPFITNYYNNSIITYSFSKSLSLPGERIGYILVNKNATDAIDIYSAVCGSGRSLGYVCAPTLFQYSIPYVLGFTSDTSVYKNNAKIFYDELTKIGYKVIKPDGAFYLFVKSLCDDDKEFSNKALEYNLLIVPSESFGIKGYIRIAYCVSEKQIKASIPKFNELYQYYKNCK